MLSEVEIQKFREVIYDHYASHRREFPWRETTDPYFILISELMLQQTQTDRVLPKYQSFLERFPTIKILAKSSFSDVLKYWHGLGYNRRAKFVHQLAQTIVDHHNGIIPSSEKELIQLPGIGPYTAAAIAAFAFNKPATVIETNIRSAFLFHFFTEQENISDKQILPLIAQTVDKKDPRNWYCALMDYGVLLKKIMPNPNRKSAHYTKQSKFEGSNRQVRGMILKLLLHKPLSYQELITQIPRNNEITEMVISELISEKLIKKQDNEYTIA